MVEENNIPKTAICTFDSIIDIDMAIINLIKLKYNNSNIVKDYMLKLKESVLKNELIDRMDVNPLSIIIQESYMDQIDKLYEQIMDKEYDFILDSSKPTDILKLINSWNKIGNMNISILCQNEKQVNKLKNASETLSKRYNLLINDDDLDTSNYDAIIIKTYEELKYFDHKLIKAKSIYLADYVFNSIANDTASIIMNLFAKSNEFKYLGVYDRSKLILVKG